MPRKKTIEEFIADARRVHGDRYDYSQVVYKGSHEKVCIICPKHGEFWQDANNHISRKSICPKCSREQLADINRSDTETFISKARIVHGDKYDYSQVDYEQYDKRVCIVCPKHGPFFQTPHIHLGGHGCPKCANLYSPSTEEFVSSSKALFGNKYDYSKTVYHGNKKKVCIICPEHGEFWVTPNNHLTHKVGCSRCTGYYDLTLEEFLEEANKRFDNKYDYSRVVWKGFQKRIEIVCPEHGSFHQTPMSHLKTLGCPKCSGRYMDQEYFIQKSTAIHGGKYDYSKVKYLGNKEKVCIICPEHGEFWQSPNAHLLGCGCSKCSGQYMDTDYFKEKASIVHSNKYDYSLVDYKGNLQKVKIICPIHGVFEQVATYHLAGNGCPACSESHMEKDIRRLLKRNQIPFVPQKSFDWLVLEGKLFIDFFLPDYGVGIECQGGQHFESVEYFGGDEMFKRTKLRDALKKKLCNDHGIELIYYSDIGIDYPYPVYEDPTLLLNAIKSRGKVDSNQWRDPVLPLFPNE